MALDADWAPKLVSKLKHYTRPMNDYGLLRGMRSYPQIPSFGGVCVSRGDVIVLHRVVHSVGNK